jgi:hypothetical protein
MNSNGKNVVYFPQILMCLTIFCCGSRHLFLQEIVDDTTMENSAPEHKALT